MTIGRRCYCLLAAAAGIVVVLLKTCCFQRYRPPCRKNCAESKPVLPRFRSIATVHRRTRIRAVFVDPGPPQSPWMFLVRDSGTSSRPFHLCFSSRLSVRRWCSARLSIPQVPWGHRCLGVTSHYITFGALGSSVPWGQVRMALS